MPDLRDEFEAWKRTQVDQDAWSAVLWATERAAKKEREAALDDAYNAMFHIKGCKVTRFDAQTAIAKLKEKA